ncbi:MAG: sigma-70 family RNA polymerase sigma factor [Acidimicrobiales bacterium]|nr:sigma-70 family RNA polymerase sigma factor [Acidimicrobiales bacterium]
MERTGTAPEDLAAFYAEQQGRVLNTLVLMVGDRPLAEELTQETFVRVCQRWPKVRQMEAPGAWTHQVAVNLARSRLRRAKAERRALARVAGRPTGHVESSPRDPELLDALAVLPGDERAALVLRFAADFSVQQVSVTLGVPEGTVKTWTRRGLAKLRDAGIETSMSSDPTTTEVTR